MSSLTGRGVVTGTLIGWGSAFTPLGDAPFLWYLEQANVASPIACLGWIKTQSGLIALSPVTHPCSPINDPQGLAVLSNWLVVIALALIVWGGFELVNDVRDV